MRFLVRKRRTTPAVIIVALIDVLIVLVIFLLVTTTFKQQAALKLALPESSQAKKAGANENPPFVVSIDGKGIYYRGQTAGDLRAVAKPTDFESVNQSAILCWPSTPTKRRRGEKIVKVRDAAAEAKIKSLVAYTKEKPNP